MVWYFFPLYIPEINKVDAVNLMVHVFNSVIMLIDLMIVGHPIKLTHAYWTMGIGLAYSIFSLVYFLSGGTTRWVQINWQRYFEQIHKILLALLNNRVLEFSIQHAIYMRVQLHSLHWISKSYFITFFFSSGFAFLFSNNRKNTTAIYPLLDWSKPGKSIIVSAAGILCVLVIHFIVFIMYRCRVCIFNKVCVRGHHDDDKLNGVSSMMHHTHHEQYSKANTVVELKL